MKNVRLVDDQGEQLGIMSLSDALKLAEENELDLVEVAPNSEPPVCRLLDYGKFRYVQNKKEKEARKTQKFTELREVRFRTRISKHDQDAKVKIMSKLLETGAKVKVSVMFRGREVTHPEIGMTLLRGVAEALKDEAKLEKTPSMEGRFMTIILTPNARKDIKPEDETLEELEEKEEQKEEELSSA